MDRRQFIPALGLLLLATKQLMISKQNNKSITFLKFELKKMMCLIEPSGIEWEKGIKACARQLKEQIDRDILNSIRQEAHYGQT